MQAEWAQACIEVEYLKAHQWSPAALKHVQNNYPLFPTLNQFTAPVAGLPQFPKMDTRQWYSTQSTTIFRTLEGPAWSHPAHNSGASETGPNFSPRVWPPTAILPRAKRAL
ncbi:hypothetical protein P692DRAFT_20527782 [Suillus brevipes Sb2]|nr:hypothetical protein P692DRAFT_20527782 [Suillus brevipes Sb2]